MSRPNSPSQLHPPDRSDHAAKLDERDGGAAASKLKTPISRTDCPAWSMAPFFGLFVHGRFLKKRRTGPGRRDRRRKRRDSRPSRGGVAAQTR